MGEGAKKIGLLASHEDQPCPEKSTLMAPSKLFRSASSSFQVWQKPSGKKSLGDAVGHNNPHLELQPAISNTFSTQAANNHNETMENPTLDQAEKTIINGSFAIPVAGVNVNTRRICEGQARQPSCLDLNLAIMEEDPKKQKRMLANRVYSKTYRWRKANYITNLENLTSTLESKIFNIHLEIERNKIMQRPLLFEHHQLKLQIAALEKDRILKEAEIEKNIEEVKRLRELQMNRSQVFSAGSGSLKTEVET